MYIYIERERRDKHSLTFQDNAILQVVDQCIYKYIYYIYSRVCICIRDREIESAAQLPIYTISRAMTSAHELLYLKTFVFFFFTIFLFDKNLQARHTGAFSIHV